MREPVIGHSAKAGGSGASHPVVRNLYDNVPIDKQSETHGHCGEADALSRIAAESNTANGEQLKAVVRGAKAITLRNDGKPLPCCTSCAYVTQALEIEDQLGQNDRVTKNHRRVRGCS